MNINFFVRSKAARAMALVLACALGAAHADDYADISQLLKSGKFVEAMSKIDNQLIAKPGDAQLRFMKGVTQRNLGKTAEAIATFTKLTQDYPDLPEPHNNLAVLFASQGQYDKARLSLEKAIRTNPSYATAHENIGDIYARLASQAYNKALQLDDSNTVVPPKLALIRELFKPNQTGGQPASTGTVLAAAVPVKPTTKAATPSAAPPAPAVAPVVPINIPKATPAPPDNAETHKSVETAVLAWAEAWSHQDVLGYFAAYSPQFTPQRGQTRNGWEKERRDRILGKPNISVTVSDFVINVSGDKATARFRQVYKAGAMLVKSTKTLDLQRNAVGWQITREASGN